MQFIANRGTIGHIENNMRSQTPYTVDSPQFFLQLTTAYVPCAALWVAAQLNIADLIGYGSQPAAELAI